MQCGGVILTDIQDVLKVDLKCTTTKGNAHLPLLPMDDANATPEKIGVIQIIDTQRNLRTNNGEFMNLNQKAHEIMGKCWHDWRLSTLADWKYQCDKCQDMTNYKSLKYPKYTESIADAFELIKFAESKNICVIINTSESNHVQFWERSDTPLLGESIAETIPFAITRAFIEAMENQQ